MARKHTAPRLVADITPEIWDTAKAADSGSCLIADTIKAHYPHLSAVTVDTQLTRVTDKAAGKRYTYLTPRNAGELLLTFDQGWSYPTDHVIKFRVPIHVGAIVRNREATRNRDVRKTELIAKRDAGTLSGRERRALQVMEENDQQHPPRPSGRGPISDVIPRREGNATVVGGRPPRTAPKHPNMLAGKNRLFGKKTAQPAQVFREAVAVEVARRLTEMGGAGGGATQPTTPPTSEA